MLFMCISWLVRAKAENSNGTSVCRYGGMAVIPDTWIEYEVFILWVDWIVVGTGAWVWGCYNSINCSQGYLTVAAHSHRHDPNDLFHVFFQVSIASVRTHVFLLLSSAYSFLVIRAPWGGISSTKITKIFVILYYLNKISWNVKKKMKGRKHLPDANGVPTYRRTGVPLAKSHGEWWGEK